LTGGTARTRSARTPPHQGTSGHARRTVSRLRHERNAERGAPVSTSVQRRFMGPWRIPPRRDLRPKAQVFHGQFLTSIMRRGEVAIGIAQSESVSATDITHCPKCHFPDTYEFGRWRCSSCVARAPTCDVFAYCEDSSGMDWQRALGLAYDRSSPLAHEDELGHYAPARAFDVQFDFGGLSDFRDRRRYNG